jgi:hypothetical protein
MRKGKYFADHPLDILLLVISRYNYNTIWHALFLMFDEIKHKTTDFIIQLGYQDELELLYRHEYPIL